MFRILVAAIVLAAAGAADADMTYNSTYNSSTTAQPARQYSGEAVLGVTNATAFVSDTPAKDAVTAGIAQHVGVNTSHVDTAFSVVGAARRLSEDEKSRRLEGEQVKVEFTITIPSTLSMDEQDTAINSITSMTKSQLESKVKDRLAAAGITTYNVTVASFTAATEVTTEVTTSSGAELSLGFQIRIGLPFVVLCTLSIAGMLNM